MVYLRHVPMPAATWDALEQGAADLRSAAKAANGHLIEASSTWSGFVAAYQHPETQAQVLAALAELTGPMADWASSLGAAAGVLEDFVAEARPAAEELLSLETFGSSYRFGYPQLFDGSAVEEVDLPVVARIEALDAKMVAALSKWDGIVDAAVSSFGSITIGTGDGLPAGDPFGFTSQLPPVFWTGLKGRAEKDFGPRNPEVLVASLQGLTDSELLEWARANPDLAQMLTNSRLDGNYTTGSPEQLMQAAIGDGQPKNSAQIQGIRDAWLALSPADRSRLMIAFPGVLASLNGIPFADRVKGNKVAVVGEHRNVSERLVVSKTMAAITGGMAGVSAENNRMHGNFAVEVEQLKGQFEGLDWAMSHDSDLILIGTEVDGNIVSMNGVFTDQTQKVFTMVPGTGTDVGSFGGQATLLSGIQGDMTDKVSFYWQGADLPDAIPHNASPEYSNRGGKQLALFDMAVDLETRPDIRSTYLGYSAGASMLGAAEKEGLDSTNILYVAPAGTGPGVHGTGDTQNAEANRYWIQTRDDQIRMTQGGPGGMVHGGSPQQLGAIRLEAGFMDPTDPDSLLSGHEKYFTPGSTSVSNIQGVIDGTGVSLFVQDEYVLNEVQGEGMKIVSPETAPEKFTGDQLTTVTTESLE